MFIAREPQRNSALLLGVAMSIQATELNAKKHRD